MECPYYNTCVTDTLQGVRIRTWVPHTDIPVIYGIKRLNKI